MLEVNIATTYTPWPGSGSHVYLQRGLGTQSLHRQPLPVATLGSDKPCKGSTCLQWAASHLWHGCASDTMLFSNAPSHIAKRGPFLIIHGCLLYFGKLTMFLPQPLPLPQPQLWTTQTSGLFLKHGSHMALCSAPAFTSSSTWPQPVFPPQPWSALASPAALSFHRWTSPSTQALFSLSLKSCAHPPWKGRPVEL